jgi:hypothetical protein
MSSTLKKREGMQRLANLDKVLDLLRKSSRDKLVDQAKLVKENKTTNANQIIKSISLLNLKN